MKQTAWTLVFLLSLGGIFAFTDVGGVVAGLEQSSPSSEKSASPLSYLHNQYFVSNISQQKSSEQTENEASTPSQTAPFSVKTHGTDKPQITADAALVMDLKSEQVLYSRKPYTEHKIASITKLMTGMVILDEYTYGKRGELPMSRSAFEAYGGNYILPRETLSVEELLHALLMASSNDAAARLAEHFGGEAGQKGFVEKMNEKADNLDLYKTRFVNPHGLNEKEKEQHSTAFDVMQMGEHVYTTYPTLTKILKVEETELTTTDGRTIPVGNINKLLGKLKTEGGKTGYTEQAGETFFTVADIDGRDVGFVVLGSEMDKRFEDTRTLIEWTRKTYNTDSRI